MGDGAAGPPTFSWRSGRGLGRGHGLLAQILLLLDDTSPQVIDGMQTIIEQAHARGIQVHGVTIIPRHNRAPTSNNSGWTPAKTRVRNEVNAWIRGDAPFDGVLDFDAVVRDPANPDLILPAFNCDDIHPTSRGYYEMGWSVPLDLFAR